MVVCRVSNTATAADKTRKTLGVIIPKGKIVELTDSEHAGRQGRFRSHLTKLKKMIAKK